ncbi:MAG: hypothetical protein K1X44_08695 [Alphaproteobacteria bacterium]|nr:hypothetical protein [Alphaproteobacteria bacterium]
MKFSKILFLMSCAISFHTYPVLAENTVCNVDNVCSRNQLDTININNISNTSKLPKQQKYIETSIKVGDITTTVRTYPNGDVFEITTDDKYVGKFSATGYTTNKSPAGQSLINNAEKAVAAGKGTKMGGFFGDVYTIESDKASGTVIVIVNNKVTGKVEMFTPRVITKAELDKIIDMFEGQINFLIQTPVAEQDISSPFTLSKNLDNNAYNNENNSSRDIDYNPKDRERIKESRSPSLSID